MMDIPEPIRERRRAIRIEEALPFTIADDGYEIQAETVNISESGAMCVVDREIRMMTQLKIALRLPSLKKTSGRIIVVKGVLVRKEKIEDGRFHIAVFFSDIKPDDRAALKEYIEQRLSR